MTTYYDYYWHSADVNAFLPLLADEPNIIGPRQGDDNQWYIAVRTATPRATPDNCTLTDTAVAQALLGVWA